MRDGQLQLIRTQDEFREVFAPVQAVEEALSYALAVTRYSARYGLELDAQYEYLVDEIEDTHVEAVDDGYRVHLYYYRLCGCGPHPTSAVELHVGPDGQIEQVAVQDVYKDPDEDDLCID
jgi:hypothetical protein